MLDLIDDYLESHVSAEPELLYRLYRHTHLHHLYGRMCSGKVQGRLLKMLTSMIAPRRVLELGTFTGYSALCMAEAMAEGSELHTVEIDDEWRDEILRWFSLSEHGSKIHLHIGDAMDIVPQISAEPWDMVLIDANKRLYPQYYEMVLPLVRTGGYILADNTLWDGKVALPEPPADAQTRAIMEFNDRVATDPRVETAIIPLRDGLTLLRKV